MKAAFPYMGGIRLVLQPILERLGVEVVTPPEPTGATTEAGVQHSPELMCLPFKMTLGNMLWCVERGADTLIYVSGSWACRFGYYGRLQADILRDLGFRFELLELRHDGIPRIASRILELSRGSLPRAIWRTAAAFRAGWLCSRAVERVEATARTLRPLLADPAACTPVLGDFYRLIERTRRPAEIAELTRVCTERLAALGRSGRGRPLRVKLVGESYCALEPFVNFDMVRRLGEMGVLVDPALTPHRWLGFHGFRLGRDEAAGARAASRPYWRYCAGGEDEASLGHMIIAARAGFDGVVHVHPFACMPGTVVQPTMARVSRDYDMPFLSLSIDEHSSETGVLTRLEAFVSMLERRQRSRRTV